MAVFVIADEMIRNILYSAKHCYIWICVRVQCGGSIIRTRLFDGHKIIGSIQRQQQHRTRPERAQLVAQRKFKQTKNGFGCMRLVDFSVFAECAFGKRVHIDSRLHSIYWKFYSICFFPGLLVIELQYEGTLRGRKCAYALAYWRKQKITSMRHRNNVDKSWQRQTQYWRVWHGATPTFWKTINENCNYITQWISKKVLVLAAAAIVSAKNIQTHFLYCFAACAPSQPYAP